MYLYDIIEKHLNTFYKEDTILPMYWDRIWYIEGKKLYWHSFICNFKNINIDNKFFSNIISKLKRREVKRIIKWMYGDIKIRKIDNHLVSVSSISDKYILTNIDEEYDSNKFDIFFKSIYKICKYILKYIKIDIIIRKYSIFFYLLMNLISFINNTEKYINDNNHNILNIFLKFNLKFNLNLLDTIIEDNNIICIDDIRNIKLLISKGEKSFNKMNKSMNLFYKKRQSPDIFFIFEDNNSKSYKYVNAHRSILHTRFPFIRNKLMEGEYSQNSRLIRYNDIPLFKLKLKNPVISYPYINDHKTFKLLVKYFYTLSLEFIKIYKNWKELTNILLFISYISHNFDVIKKSHIDMMIDLQKEIRYILVYNTKPDIKSMVLNTIVNEYSMSREWIKYLANSYVRSISDMCIFEDKTLIKSFEWNLLSELSIEVIHKYINDNPYYFYQ